MSSEGSKKVDKKELELWLQTRPWFIYYTNNTSYPHDSYIIPTIHPTPMIHLLYQQYILPPWFISSFNIFHQQVTHLKQAFIKTCTPIALSLKSMQIRTPKPTLILTNDLPPSSLMPPPILSFFPTSRSPPNSPSSYSSQPPPAPPPPSDPSPSSKCPLSPPNSNLQHLKNIRKTIFWQL